MIVRFFLFIWLLHLSVPLQAETRINKLYAKDFCTNDDKNTDGSK